MIRQAIVVVLSAFAIASAAASGASGTTSQPYTRSNSLSEMNSFTGTPGFHAQKTPTRYAQAVGSTTGACKDDSGKPIACSSAVVQPTPTNTGAGLGTGTIIGGLAVLAAITIGVVDSGGHNHGISAP